MIKKSLVLLILFIILVVVIYAQSETEQGEDFWFGIGGEASSYSLSGFAYGGSFSLGFGTGTSIGIKTIWFFNSENIDIIELIFFFRYYLQGLASNSGPFIQIMGGSSLFFNSGDFSIPFDLGIISAGLSFGWRFLFSDRWFVEPAVRAGFPYMIGAGISAGVRF